MDGGPVSEYIVIAGMSGAGRSTASAALEDAGWYVIDNMPASLLMNVADVLGRAGDRQERVVLVIGRGGGPRPRRRCRPSTQLAGRRATM